MNKHRSTIYRWNKNGGISLKNDIRGRSYLTNNQLLNVIEEHDIKYYKITEAAGIVGVHESTIYNWEKKEQVRFIKDRDDNACVTENQSLDML